MDKFHYSQLQSLVNLCEHALHNKEKVYAIPEVYKGVEITVMTDREGFLEYTINQIQSTLINELVQKEDVEQ